MAWGDRFYSIGWTDCQEPLGTSSEIIAREHHCNSLSVLLSQHSCCPYFIFPSADLVGRGSWAAWSYPPSSGQADVQHCSLLVSSIHEVGIPQASFPHSLFYSGSSLAELGWFCYLQVTFKCGGWQLDSQMSGVAPQISELDQPWQKINVGWKGAYCIHQGA